MIRLALVGEMGSGKSFISNLFNYPVFSADLEVANIYKDAKKKNILKQLKKRKNFNQSLINQFKFLQYPLRYKKKKSDFIIKNNYKIKSAKNNVKKILKKVK